MVFDIGCCFCCVGVALGLVSGVGIGIGMRFSVIGLGHLECVFVSSVELVLGLGTWYLVLALVYIFVCECCIGLLCLVLAWVLI